MDPTTREHAEALLLKAARAYGIQVRKDEVQQHLRNEKNGAAFAEWAITHLTPDNLLTAEELALYTALDRGGEVDELTAVNDLAEVQAVAEDDIKIAVEELRRSTESISKQSETLRQQHDALSRLVKKHGDNYSRRRDLDLSRQSKSETERQRVAAEVEAASQSLGYRISDLEEQGALSGSNLTGTLNEIFRSDDKLLSSLQKLGCELDQPDPDETQKLDKMRETCTRLVKITVKTIRAKLDTIYLDALVAAERSGRAKPATEGEVKALEAAIESLYSEILPLAEMSVEQQHLGPALKSATAQSGQSAIRTSTALEYVNECLDYLLSRLERIQDRIETHMSHQAAAVSVIATAKTEMAAEVLPPAKQAAASPFASSPLRNGSPGRKRANTVASHSRRRSSGIPDEPPLDTLMQSLSLPSAAFEETEGKAQINILAKTLEERSRKYKEVARSAQESFEMSAIAQLNDTRRAIQQLRDSLLTESPYNQVRLIDPEILGSISVLGQEVEKAKEKLAVIEGLKVDCKSEKREELLQRWG